MATTQPAKAKKEKPFVPFADEDAPDSSLFWFIKGAFADWWHSAPIARMAILFGIPRFKRRRLRFVTKTLCYEVDVIWCTRLTWWIREDQKCWSTIDIGGFVLAIQLRH